MAALDLPDLNVWLALADADHEHHSRAHEYWQTEAAVELAFCRVTMLGFLRLLTNRKVMRDAALTPDEAWGAYRNFLALAEVIFIDEPVGTESQMAAWSDDVAFAPQRWTDVWLAAQAFCAGGRIVSFDGDFRAFPGLTLHHLVP